MSRRHYYGYNRGRQGSKVFWIFLGIVAFAAIYFPFFGGNLRYQIGTFVSQIFQTIGIYLFIGGVVLLFYGLVRLKLKSMLLGGILLWVAITFVEPGLWGILTNGVSVPKGYH